MRPADIITLHINERSLIKSTFCFIECSSNCDEEIFYVSYCPEDGPFLKKVVEFTLWFREQGYNVQMDVMQTPKNESQLRQLGRLRFSELQLKRAKNVLMVVSPGYLKLCKLDESHEATKGRLSNKELQVFSEITQIRSELCSTMYRNSRFIPVLFGGVKETELPFWIKDMVVFSWPEDKMNNRLLFRLAEQVEYSLL